MVEFDHRALRKAKSSILWFEDWTAATRNHIEILRSLGLIESGFLVVDYGCGIGRITKAIAEASDLRVIAVDRSAEMRRHATKYISAPLFTNGKVQLLSDTAFLEGRGQLEGTVDSVLCFEVIQHIPEPIIDEILPSLTTVLKPGGQMFVFGNEQLDVGANGAVFPNTPPIRSVLQRHLHIIREDVWETGFSATRYSFLCERRK